MSAGHAHGHAPGWGHGHEAELRAADRRALRAAFAITATFLLVEVVGGVLSGSLALLADAGHMATDAAALGLALFALRMADRAPTPEKTFGWRRTEILAALANGSVLVLVSVGVAFEAMQRLQEPPEIRGGLMLAVAVAGLAANLACAALLARGRAHSLNLRGAFLHVIGDALGSVGAIVAALLIAWKGWLVADAAIALAIAALILVSAVRLVRESVDVLMEATPAHVDLAALDAAIRAVPGVRDVHDLHAWTLTSGYHAMSAHVDVDPAADSHAVLHTLEDLVRSRFGIAHTTFQLEPAEPLLDIAPHPGAGASGGAVGGAAPAGVAGSAHGGGAGGRPGCAPVGDEAGPCAQPGAARDGDAPGGGSA